LARFIDYGNTEKKKKYEFYDLPADLRNSPPAALKIKLKNTDRTVKDLEDALFYVKVDLMIDSEGVGTFYKDGVELFQSESAAKVCSCLVMAIVIFNLLNRFFKIFFSHFFPFLHGLGCPRWGFMQISSRIISYTYKLQIRMIYLLKFKG